MSKSKRILSVLLAFAVLASSIFVGGLIVSAETVKIVNNYDDGLFYETVLNDNQLLTRHKFSEDAAFSSNYDALAAWNAEVNSCAVDETAGYAAHFVAAKNYNSRWPAAVKLYDNDKKGEFWAAANTTYEIKLKYYAATTPNIQVNLQVRQRSDSGGSTSQSYPSTFDPSGILVFDLATITEATNGWVEASAQFTVGSKDAAIHISAASATTASAKNVDIWVDDITLVECSELTVHNYDGENDKKVPVSEFTTIAKLDVPHRDGYIFRGVYADAELTRKIDTSVVAGNFTEVWYKWAKLEDGEYYAGFENYLSDANVISYDNEVSEIVSGNTYAGNYMMQTVIEPDGIAAFELRDDKAFNVRKDTEYTVSFVYKSTSDAELYIGLANSNDVPATAYAIEGGKIVASNEWKTSSVTLTLDNGTVEGYSLAMLLNSEEGATVYIDDVFVTYPFDDTTVNMPSVDGFTKDWYPALDSFGPKGEVKPVEKIEIWNGSTVAPQDTDNDGVYEITSGAELAYIIVNGGAADAKYILTKDIYLNDINKVNWTTGEAAEGYIPNSWYAEEAFQGTIDGNGHTVYGLYYNNTDAKAWGMYGTGLIPKVNHGTTVLVTGLGIDKAYINYPHGASAFVGCGGTSNASSTSHAIINIDRCYAGADVMIQGNDAGVFRGASRGSDVVVSNSYSLATTVGKQFYGLFGGESWESSEKVINTYNANGTLANKANVSAVNSFQTAAGYVTSNVISADKMQGKDVFLADDKMLFFNIDGTFVATESYPVPAVFAGVEEVDMDVWDGTVASSFAGGTGTETDPYLIATPEQLALAITSSGADETYFGMYFKLTDDIYLNNINAFRWSDGKVASGHVINSWYNASGQQFAGTIDGDGHIVYGLYHNKSNGNGYSSTSSGCALVPKVVSASAVTITKLGVEYSYIKEGYSVAALVAIGKSNIDQCYVGSDVMLNALDVGAFVGHTASTSCTFSNSYSLATAVTTGKNYGLVGQAYNSTPLTISKCYNANGPLTSFANTGYNTYYKFYDSYQTVVNGIGATSESRPSIYVNITTVASVEDMKGQDVFTNADKMPNLLTSGTYTATEGYPVLTAFVKEASSDSDSSDDSDIDGGTTSIPSEITVWDGTSSAPASTATGDSAADPIIITNGAELHYVIRTTGGEGKYYKLANDIYLNDLTKINWRVGVPSSSYDFNGWFGYWETPAFSGHIDGDNHVIYGLYFDQETTKDTYYSASGAGLIPQIAENAEASIKNLGIDNMFLHYESCVGGFVGSALNGSTLTIENCFLGSEVILDAPSTAAFCAVSVNATTTVENCYSLAKQNYLDSAGLVSQHWNGGAGTITVKNSYNANGPIISYVRSATVALENCFQTKSGAYNTGATTLTAENMKGADVTTNSQKMKSLANFGFVPTERTFADYDYYTYLPTGTVIDSALNPLFFDTYFAPLDAGDVLYLDKMTRGAYVKFTEAPDVDLIKIPASVADKVHAGSSAEIIERRGEDYFFGIEFDIASDIISTESAGAVNYIFITDLHYGYDSAMDQASLLKQVAYVAKMANENDGIDFVCLGGDITQGNASTKEGQLKLLNTILTPLLECEKPVFALAGNHDDNAYSTFKAEKVLNNQDWNDNVIDYVVNRSTSDGDKADVQVVQDTDLSNGPSKYYYYDLEAKKTRVVCLDAINYPYSWNEETQSWDLAVKNASASSDRSKYYNGYNTWGYSTKQIEWLAEVVLTCDDGWDYVFLSHMGIDEATNSNTVLNGKQLRDLIKAYQFKTPYTFADTDLSDGEDDSISVDYSNTNGRILSYHFGHNHYEKEIYSEDIDLWQIITSTANPGNKDNVTQTLKTETEVHFDVMFVSRGDIYKHNIGSGRDIRLINTNVNTAGDINKDKNTDIFDLVMLNNVANGNEVPTKLADVDKDNKISVVFDSASLRKIILGIK